MGNFDGGGLTGKSDSFILRVDSNGNQLGIVQDGSSYGSNGKKGRTGHHIAFDSSGNYYQAGLTDGDVDGLSHSHSSMPGYSNNLSLIHISEPTRLLSIA